MATALSLIQDAYLEIGVLQPGEPMSADLAALGLSRLQGQIDSWQADRLTLSLQGNLSVSWPAATSTRTIGPTGGNITAQRPMWINTVTYEIPGASPAVEVAIGALDEDSFANLTIKTLPSALPLQYFYQTNLSDGLGTLTLWPQPTQTLTLHVYAPQAVTVPALLTTDVSGPPGYREAFLYQLALRLCTPTGTAVPPLLPNLATQALATMKRPNIDPGQLSIDAALVPNIGGGYNILADTMSSYGGR